MAKPTIATCGGCGEMFTSLATFDAHRVGEYDAPVARPQEKQATRTTPVTHHTRRCLTLAELRAAGLCAERRWITVMHEGVASREEHEVWYDPVARESTREAFEKEKEASAPPDASQSDLQPQQALFW
jgi:hypothetical protein